MNAVSSGEHSSRWMSRRNVRGRNFEEWRPPRLRANALSYLSKSLIVCTRPVFVPMIAMFSIWFAWIVWKIRLWERVSESYDLCGRVEGRPVYLVDTFNPFQLELVREVHAWLHNIPLTGWRDKKEKECWLEREVSFAYIFWKYPLISLSLLPLQINAEGTTDEGYSSVWLVFSFKLCFLS